ncbi:3'-5' exonuclease [Frateuria aurantia]
MARLIPQRSTCLPQMTSGEKRFSERLEDKLEDDYLVWYNVPVGHRQQRPDFIVLHPGRGILVLEIKDWKVDTILQADRQQFSLATANGLVKKPNPLLQARIYSLEINTVLETDPALRHPAHSRYAGKLAMPWGYGVVLSRITRRQFNEGQLEAVIPGHLVICQDEMYDHVDAEQFQGQLWAMFSHVFPVALSLPQIDRVRWHLFPELRVHPGEGQFGLFDQPQQAIKKAIEIPDLIKVMDQQQETLARSLGSGHRIIHGVAGSGKTMILGFRAVQLAQELPKPVLILCYNKVLAGRLQEMIGQRGLADKIQVYNFHRWCHRMLSTYHVPVPQREDRPDFDAMAPAVIAAVDRGQIPRAQYGAVLVDEGQDFEPDWYRLIVQMVDPASKALLVLYDDAQNIHGKPDRPGFTWKSVGIEAVGHTTILKLNYRNTLEILSVARDFAHELLHGQTSDDDGVPLIPPESAGRRGAIPELVRAEHADDEARLLLERITQEQQRGRPLSEIAVLARSSHDGKQWHARLEAAGLPARLAQGAGKSSLFVEGATVKVITMHSSKGLEFPVVLIPGLGRMPAAGHDETQEARLLYVAMTRATERLVLLHDRESVFSRRIREAINQVQEQLSGQPVSI